jgi:hypothetical protein
VTKTNISRTPTKTKTILPSREGESKTSCHASNCLCVLEACQASVSLCSAPSYAYSSLHNEMETRGVPIAVMYVRGVRIYAHRYFCVVPTPVCVIYANCSCLFYFSTPNDHVSSLLSIPLVYLLKLNSELFFFHVIFLYVFPSRAPRARWFQRKAR